MIHLYSIVEKMTSFSFHNTIHLMLYNTHDVYPAYNMYKYINNYDISMDNTFPYQTTKSTAYAVSENN